MCCRRLWLISTHASIVVSTPHSDNLAAISPCFHEEADIFIFVHVADQASNGFKRIVIRTTDSDVLVIAVSVVQHIKDLCELWIVFGCGSNLRYIPAHTIARQLGNARASALPVFHVTPYHLYMGKGKNSLDCMAIKARCDLGPQCLVRRANGSD